MASDDDTIFVDVKAQFDERSADEVTGRLRDKLKDGVRGTGKAISDVLHSELAQDLGRSIGPVAHDIGVQLGKELGSKAGDLLHEQMSNALAAIGVDFDGIIDKAHGLADEFGVDADSVGKIADAFKAAKIGDQAKAFGDLASALGKVPGPIGEVAQQSKGLLDTYDHLKGDIKDTTGLFSTFADGAPRFATAFDMIGKAAGPVALTLGTISALDKDFAGDMDNLLNGLQTHDPSKILSGGGGMMWQSLKDYSTLFGLAPMPWEHPGEQHTTKSFTFWPGYKGSGPPGLNNMLLPGETQPKPGGSIAPPSIGAAPIPGIRTAPSGFASPGASVPLIQNPDGTVTSSNPSWAHLIQRESGGRNVRQGIIDVNSGGNEAEGYFQITPKTWAAHGGTEFAPSPLAATPQQQAMIAARILQGNPSGSDWGAGLPGRESAGALLGGLGAAPAAITPGGGPIRATLADYTRPAGTGLGMRPAGFGIPPDIPGLPGLGPQGVPGTIPGQFGPQGIGSPPNLDQTHTYSQKQQQQLGSGQGFGLTGGGLIGLLEQLPGMAASAAGGASSMFGGGAAGGAAAAAWSDIAVPEINLAAQKGGQMIAAAAEAPLETFGLTGGQMGAPSVNPQSGWIGKMLGSMLGSQFSMPNIAGSVQPPKQGGDKDSSGQGDDSSPGGKSQQEQAGGGGAAAGGGKPGPTGHKDDPIHVKQVPPPGGAPQGQATSAMNTAGVMSAITA